MSFEPKSTDCTTIINVADPENSKIVWQGKTDTDKSHTHKVRVADDIMVTNVEQNNRHVQRTGLNTSDIRAMLEEAGKGTSDRPWRPSLAVKSNSCRR